MRAELGSLKHILHTDHCVCCAEEHTSERVETTGETAVMMMVFFGNDDYQLLFQFNAFLLSCILIAILHISRLG